MPAKKPKVEIEDATLHAEWFPVYGIRIKELPHVIAFGQDEAKALANFAGLMASEGKRLNKRFRAQFQNEPFEIE